MITVEQRRRVERALEGIRGMREREARAWDRVAAIFAESSDRDAMRAATQAIALGNAVRDTLPSFVGAFDGI